MTWKRRLLVGVKLALLAIYLDGAFLIYIRSVDNHGIYQTVKMKWMTFLIWTLVCLLIGLVEELFFFVWRRRAGQDKTNIF